MVQAFLNNLVRGKAEGGKGLSPKTAINIHGVFHRALKQAVNIGLIRSNPTDACIRPRGERKPIRPLEDEEVGAFLRAIEGHRFASLYLVDLFTGMRQGEILGLTWDCVDFRRGTIFLYRQLQQRQTKGDFGYYFTSLKNGKSRTITPAPTVMRVLQAHRKAQNEMRLRAVLLGTTTKNWYLLTSSVTRSAGARYTKTSNRLQTNLIFPIFAFTIYDTHLLPYRFSPATIPRPYRRISGIIQLPSHWMCTVM